jgi:hypothetical protein
MNVHGNLMEMVLYLKALIICQNLGMNSLKMSSFVLGHTCYSVGEGAVLEAVRLRGASLNSAFDTRSKGFETNLVRETLLGGCLKPKPTLCYSRAFVLAALITFAFPHHVVLRSLQRSYDR